MSSIPYNYGKYIDDTVKLRDQGTVDAGRQMNSPASAGSRGLAKTMQFSKDKTQMQMGNSPIAESMIEIRNILNRIDGVNAPVQEDEHISPEIKSQGMRDFLDIIIDKDEPNVYDQMDDSAKILYKYNSMTGNKLSREQIDMLTDLRQKDDVEFEKQLTKAGVDLEKLGQVAKQYKDDPYESAVQEAPKDSDIDYAKLMLQISAMKDKIAELPIDDDRKTSALTALGQVEDDLSMDESAVKEDLDYRSEDILNKAGFDPADIDTYMKVFNDHGDTSDLEQMNMKEKVGLAEVMSIVLASHGIQNESYQPMPEGDEFDIEEDEDFEEVLGPLGFPEDETELFDAEYRGRKVPLNKPMRGDVKKFKVYVKDPKTGNVKKVNFGHGGTSAKRKTMRIRKSNPKARKSFRARHNCANPGPKTKARYWSCRKW